MALKFHGEYDELQARIEAVGVTGEWEEKPNSCYRLKLKNGAGVNWSANKGTLWFDGKDPYKAQLEQQVETAISGSADAVLPPQEGDSTVFVVHGHDTAARQGLELVLHKLGLEPFVLQNTDGGGKTIVENLEAMIGKNAQSSFGIVLLTPDDMGYAKADGNENEKPRARQNVILEMGMLLSSLTRERVVILQKGFVEPPSDIQGIIYLNFNDHVSEVAAKLASRLSACGFEIPAERIANAASQ